MKTKLAEDYQHQLHSLNLLSLLKRIQKIINSRVVSWKSGNFLTRQDLLAGRRPDVPREKDVIDAPATIRTFHAQTDYIDNFVEEWWDKFFILQHEELLKIHKHRFTALDVPDIGDIVLILDMASDTGSHNIGRIEGVEDSADGQNRHFVVAVAKPTKPGHPYPLKTPPGKKSTAWPPKPYRRPAHQLALLIRKADIGQQDVDGSFPEVTRTHPESESAPTDTGLEVVQELPNHHPGSLGQGQVQPYYDPITLDQEQEQKDADPTPLDKEVGPTPPPLEEDGPTLRTRRSRPPLGFYAGMLLALTWMLIATCPAYAEVKVNPRGLCPVTYDIGSIHLIKEQINDTADSWRNNLVSCLPGQLGVIGGRPIFRASGESWEEAEKGCKSFQAGTLEIRNRNELLELSGILKNNGLSGIATRALLQSDKITYQNHKPWDWLTPSNVQNIITPLLPAKYLGTPINKQVKLIRVSKVKEARRSCEKFGGELISFDTPQHVKEIARQLNITAFLISIFYDKSTESLFWPNGKTFYLPDLEATIKGKEEYFQGMAAVNASDLTYQVMTDPSSLPFICTLPYLVKEEIFSMTLSSDANISVGLSKVDSSLAPGVALLCRGKENMFSKRLDELQMKVDQDLLNLEEKDPSVQQLLGRLATIMEPRNPYPQPKGCWPHYIKPLKDFKPSKPTCLASLQDQEKNRRNFVKYLHQVAALQTDVQMATL